MFAKDLRKILSVMLVMLLAIGMSSGLKAEAKDKNLKTPEIKVKASSNSIKITIPKTKGADGYEVILDYNPDVWYQELYAGAGELKGVLSDTSFTGKNASKGELLLTLCKDSPAVNTIKIDLNGSKKRTVTLKSVPAGTFTIKVRSYKAEKNGALNYSEPSKAKTVSIKYDTPNIGSGYSDKYDFSSVKEGDIIKFGSYEQDNNSVNGFEAIEWLVLKKTAKSMLVVSRQVLDDVPYNSDFKDATWKDCTLRNWLNDNFYSVAFNKTEKDMIKTVTLTNDNNAQYGTTGGKNTKDKVFLLSASDLLNAEYGFNIDPDEEDIARRCAPTAYAKTHTEAFSDVKTADGEYTCNWWLRSPGRRANYAVYVYHEGSFSTDGHAVSSDGGVRPALYIKLR